MPDEREKFSLTDMEAAFDIQRVSLGGPIFDVEKLKWLNGLWIREDLDVPALAKRLQDWALNEAMLMKVLPHAQGRMEVLADFVPMSAYLASGELSLAIDDFASLSEPLDETVERLQFVLWRLEALQNWERGAIFECLKGLANELGLKPKALFAPLFIAVAGSTAAYSMPDSMSILGPDMTRARLRRAIEVLGGVSKKAAKRLEKEYASLSSAE